MVNNIIYPVSRALIGNEMADQLKFPKKGMPFPLFSYRIDQRIRRLRTWIGREGNSQNFSTLLQSSAYDETGFSYRLPDHAHSERSQQW